MDGEHLDHKNTESVLKQPCTGSISHMTGEGRWVNTHCSRGLLEGLMSEAGYVVDDRGEVGGTVEFDLGQTSPVGLHHTFNTCTHSTKYPHTCRTAALDEPAGPMSCERTGTEWIRWVEVERKLMGDLQHNNAQQICYNTTNSGFSTGSTRVSRFSLICSVIIKCHVYLPCGRDLSPKAKGRKHLVAMQKR